MFRKDEYIVCLEGSFGSITNPSVIGRVNYCVKQMEDSNSLYIYQALDDDIYSKSNNSYTYDKCKNLKDWRYATSDEIKEYERLGEPYDVTTLAVEPENYDYLIPILNNLK